MKKNLGILWTTALALTFFLTSCSSSSNEVTSSAPINTCQTASGEDLNNINEGMISTKFQVESGFIADFSPEDIEAITQVFPS